MLINELLNLLEAKTLDTSWTIDELVKAVEQARDDTDEQYNPYIDISVKKEGEESSVVFTISAGQSVGKTLKAPLKRFIKGTSFDNKHRGMDHTYEFILNRPLTDEEVEKLRKVR